MGLLLICPDCQTRGLLRARTCRYCGADLRDLPREKRRYVIGAPESAAAFSSPAAVPALIPEPLKVTGIRTIPEESGEENDLKDNQEVSLCEALDRILNKGAVLFGEVMISVANIDLIYLGLQVILASMETARGLKSPWEPSNLGADLYDRRAGG
jgi:hypothetical protein